MKKNAAPEWFCRDMRGNVPENEIREKIRIEIYNEVINRGYDTNYWTDDFIKRISVLYYKLFDQLYMQNA